MKEKASQGKREDGIIETKIKVGQWNIIGYSRAGIATTILLDNFKLCFDYGIAIPSALRANKVFISHGHLDHFGSLVFHGRRRLLMKYDKPTYYFPYFLTNHFKNYYNAMLNLDYSTKKFTHLPIIDVECISVNTDSSIYLANKYIMRVFEMKHKVPSYGYVVFSQRKKLKEKYRGLSKKEINEVKKTEEISEHFEHPEVAYTGDTSIEGVLEYEAFLRADVLLMECSFFDIPSVTKVDPEAAKKRKHIHFQDIVKNKHLFKNKDIVIFHISNIYNISQVRDKIKKLDKMMSSNVHLLA